MHTQPDESLEGQPYTLEFGSFTMEFPQRILYRHGHLVRVGGRALAVLSALLDASGKLLSREALMIAAWPTTVVDEGALRVHISALRKVLGEGQDNTTYIFNESGRGYRFALPVRRHQTLTRRTTDTVVAEHNLPGQISAMLGRDEAVPRLTALLIEKRCLTIAGPGGIGKTTVAIAIAHEFMARTRQGVCFVDLAPLTAAESLHSALAAALNVVLSGTDSTKEIVSQLQRRQSLLVLDNCEHLVETVAILVERLLQLLPNVRILLTSREPLRAQGEWVHRLASLGVPGQGAELTAEDAIRFPAVKLFVERAGAVRGNFTLDDQNVVAVCEICRRLDGIPLAIEFAAARMDWFDVHAINGHLDTRFKLLTKGRRTALPRHQTLRATLDWSYELLGEWPRAVLQRISLFRSSFTMQDMLAVALCSKVDSQELFETASDLIAKSLLTSTVREGIVHYRLLDTTRFYAMDLLAVSGDEFRIRKLHVKYCRSLFVDQDEAWDGDVRLSRIDTRSQRIDDIRASVDWAISPGGHPAAGIDLLVASSYLWFHLSIAKEFFAAAERSLVLISGTEMANTALHAQLLICLGQSRWHAYGPEQQMSEAFEQALSIAMMLNDNSLQMRAIWGLWMHRLITGRYTESLIHAQLFYDMAVVAKARLQTSTGRNMIALSMHFLGDVQPALEWMKWVLEGDAAPERASHTNAAQVDGFLSSQGHLMIMMWMSGDLKNAMDIARATAEELVVMDHDLTICAVLATGIVPVAIGCGDTPFAASMVRLLRERAQRRGMRYWDRWGEGYAAVLDGREMDAQDATLMQLETFAALGHEGALEELDERQHHLQPSWVQPELIRRRALSMQSKLALEETSRACELAREHSAGFWQAKADLQKAQLLRSDLPR